MMYDKQDDLWLCDSNYCHSGEGAEFTKFLFSRDGIQLYELSGEGAAEFSSGYDVINGFFPDFVMEEGRYYMVCDDNGQFA